MPSTDFLKLFISDKTKECDLNGIRLCTISTDKSGTDTNIISFSTVLRRIDECIPEGMFNAAWELSTWIYTGTAIVTSYANGYAINKSSGSTDIANALSQQAVGNVVTAFEIDFGKRDAHKWLFIIV